VEQTFLRDSCGLTWKVIERLITATLVVDGIDSFFTLLDERGPLLLNVGLVNLICLIWGITGLGIINFINGCGALEFVT